MRTVSRTGSVPAVKVGDIVLLKDKSIKRLFWKLAKVVQLLEGSDGIHRAALINVANEGGPPKILKRRTRHLIPIEVSCNDESNVSPLVDLNSNEDSLDCRSNNKDVNDSSALCPTECSRPRWQAAILGECTRRTWTGH